jgi:hypothetical protein
VFLEAGASQLVGINGFGLESQESRIMQVSWSSRIWAGATAIRSCRIMVSRKTPHLAGKCRKSVNWDSLLKINLTGCSALTDMVKAVICSIRFSRIFSIKRHLLTRSSPSVRPRIPPTKDTPTMVIAIIPLTVPIEGAKPFPTDILCGSLFDLHYKR